MRQPQALSASLDMAAANLVPIGTARRYKAVPVGFLEPETLLVAMADPANVLAIDDLKLMTGYEIRPACASTDDLAGLIAKMNRLDDAVAEATEGEEDEEDPTIAAEIRESATDAPVIKLVNSIIAQAVEDGASDIHFEPHGREMRVRFRIDGVLHETTTIPRRMVPGVISRVKIMADLDIAEKRLPQDGRVTLQVEGHHVDVRIVTLPSSGSEGIVMRLLDKDAVLLTLDALGIRDTARIRFEAGFHQAYGAVLVTGPTGSGKSTTLYAALNSVNTVEKNIITIEDPVEYQLKGITQIPVNEKKGLTFARGLRSILRHDPDKIMVGEIRDEETAQIAIQSALTGHLVFTTVHANNVIDVIGRFLNMGVEPYNFVSSLNCVLAQRLTRVLCQVCKRPYQPTDDELIESGLKPSEHGHRTFYMSVGCDACNHTGYRGRTAIHELLNMSDNCREMIIERRPGSEVRRAAEAEGLRSLREAALEKVFAGVSTLHEINRVTFVEEVKMNGDEIVSVGSE